MPKLAYRTRMPRPDDPDIIARFADATRKGHPVATAATLAGISRVAHEWLSTGNAQLDAGDAQGSHAAFAAGHKQAVADFAERNLGVINEATTQAKGWLPAMTLLERRMPRDFGRNDRLEVESKVVNVNISATLGPGQRAALLAQLQEEQALIEAPKDAD
jgi:hypothetical protein